MAAQHENDIPVLVIPESLRKELTLARHQGHFGVEKTIKRILTVGWWPEVHKDTEQFIHSCQSCAANNLDHKLIKRHIQHQPIEGPWHRLQIDYIGPLPCTR